MRPQALAAVLAGALTPGCGGSDNPPRLPVVATGAGFDAPDTLRAGWHRLEFRQLPAGEGQNLVLFAVPDQLDLEAFALALDTAVTTPPPAVARGGLESPVPGHPTRVVLYLGPGRYLWASMSRAANRRRYVANGVWHEFRVTADTNHARAPEPTATLELLDFAYRGADTLPAGPHRIRVTNGGRQDHLVLLHRLDEGVTFAEWIARDGEPSTRWGGVTRLGSDQEVLLELALTPGRYVAICLIPDPATRLPHAELGMVREIVVSDGR